MATPDNKPELNTQETDNEPAKLAVDEVLERAGSGSYSLDEGEDAANLDFGNDFDPNAPAKTPETPEQPAETPEQPAETPEQPAETPEQPAETPEQPVETQKPRSKVIPRERFDELNEKFKAAQAKLAELEAARAQPPAPQQPEAPPVDLDAMEKQYMEAVLDGDTDKALSIRREIRQAELKMVAPKPQPDVPPVSASQVKAQIEFEDTVEELNEKYPVFDPNHDNHDPDLTAEAVALTKLYREQGLSPARALRKAVDRVVKGAGLDAPPQPEEAPAPPAPPAKPVIDPKLTQAKLETAAQQPPKPAGARTPAEQTFDIDQMSLEEFEALPESTKARLRGDIL